MDPQDNSFFRKVSIWLPLLLAGVLALGMFIGLRYQAASAASQGSVELAKLQRNLGGQGKVEELLRYIDAKYVEEADKDAITRKAIDAVIKELDPHSNYISSEDLIAINEQLEGNFDGIGVEFMILDDTIVVVSPLAGGPSEAVGIRAGDKIVTIEDSIVAGVELATQDIFSLLRGEKGTEVNVGIKRAGQKELLSFNITRDKIPVHSVDVAVMLDEKTGFIKVNRFSATTYDEFVQSLEKLVEKNEMVDLVIDLRHNPGGYLTQATNMLSQLFPEKGKLLVYTEGRTVKRTEYNTNGRPFYNIGKVVILIDEGSASASEIMAGAVQDHDRGVLVGRRSFGKGLVQEQYPLRDGSALRLTVARYYTPSGRCIQKDYEEEGAAAYDRDMEDRFTNGELSEKGNIEIADTTKFFTDNGYIVYGGGGITPDVFVPLDTFTLREDYLRWRQYTAGFVFRFVEQEAGLADRYQLNDFVSSYQVPNNVFQEYIQYAREQGEESAIPTNNRVLKELNRFLKARIARQLYGNEGFFAVWNKDDDMILEALKVLKTDDPLAAARKE
ncbi:S41 family peptidase [Lewinella cohaerens]|uniref:S41 family peptidase n=1 Tax=Lewinella cohaerens TaxID=70995 RepID=UPI00036CF63E|nr:S41 family peptidase [Lewinella cohaerens]